MPAGLMNITNMEIDYIWHVKNGELICDNFYIPANSEMIKPYPKSYFYVDGDRLTTGLIPDVQTAEGRPATQWYIDERLGLTCGLIPEPYIPKSGAFMNASNLQTVYIPRTCKKIGEWAFRNTALKKVCIAADCTYYPTSFPDGCEIEFYGGGGDYGQVYDSEGYACIDADGALCYIKE